MAKYNGPKYNGPKCNGKGKTRKMKGGKGDTTLVGIVYKEGCPHCDAIIEPKEDGKSIWEMAEEKIGDNCEVKKYEATKDSEAITTLKNVTVDGYPTIFKMDKNDRVTYFTVDRTPQKIYEFAVGSEQKGGKRKVRKSVSNKTKRTWWFW